MQVLIGFLVGIISGMGFGGGSILIIILVFITTLPQIEIQAINLIFFIPVGLIALIMHIKNKLVVKEIALKAAAGGIVGAVLGSMMAYYLNDVGYLRKLFGIYILVLGIKEGYTQIKKRHMKK